MLQAFLAGFLTCTIWLVMIYASEASIWDMYGGGVLPRVAQVTLILPFLVFVPGRDIVTFYRVGWRRHREEQRQLIGAIGLRFFSFAGGMTLAGLIGGSVLFLVLGQ